MNVRVKTSEFEDGIIKQNYQKKMLKTGGKSRNIS